MKIKIKDLEQLNNFAKEFSKHIRPEDVYSLKGDLGAGKTTFVQMVGKYLGVEDYITSPTFSIINIYNGEYQINHLDLYRLESPEELYQLDYEEYFYPDGVSFIEWAERAEDFLPQEIIEIEILVDGEKRIFNLIEDNERAREIGEKLNESISN